MRSFWICTAVLSFVLITPRASAIAPLTAAQLEQVCVDFQDDDIGPWSSLCVYYVKGFLDGAVATDGRVAENVAAEIEKDNAFTDRALSARVDSRLKRFGSSIYAEFCLEQPDPIADVMTHIVEELDRYDSLEGIQAQEVVYASLRRHYPCTAE